MAERICIIPARGGSKRIPRKNIRPFCGKPVIAYAIQAALEADCFGEVIVSTEDEEIRGVAESLGASVPFLRSLKTSGDDVPTVAVWREVLSEYEKRGRLFELAVSIYPAAPFVTAARLKEIIKMLEFNSDLDAVMPVVPFTSPVQRAFCFRNDRLLPFWPEYNTSRSQDLDPVYHDAGQYYAFRPEFLKKEDNLRTGRLGAILLSPLEAQDIDTPEDWLIAEMKYRFFKTSLLN